MERVESDICGAVEYHVSIVTNYICIYVYTVLNAVWAGKVMNGCG